MHRSGDCLYLPGNGPVERAGLESYQFRETLNFFSYKDSSALVLPLLVKRSRHSHWSMDWRACVELHG